MGIPADDNIRVGVYVSDGGRAKMEPGVDGLTLVGQIGLQLRSTGETALPMVTGLTLGEPQESEEERPCVVLCRAEGMDLWSIAKRCGTTVSAILAANDLQDEPGDNRLLLIPGP